MDLNLRNKVAIVTGGSRGLGRAICLGLAAEGAKVAINYNRHVEKADQLAQQIKATYDVEAFPVPGDVSKFDDIEQLFKRTEAALGDIDILINNAAIWPTAFVKDITREQWNTTFQVNLTGPFLMCREAVRRWLSAGRAGRIVNVASPAAFRGSTTGHADYAASKAGLVALTISLAREVASDGIYVNAVAPGMMNTDMAHDAIKEGKPFYIARIPLQRIAEPDEVANFVVFLASDRASYMTGATLDVTGGMLMR